MLTPYLARLDYVLIMTSEPDGEGDLFQREMRGKVKWLSEKYRDQIEIIVDGGIAEEEFLMVRDAGAAGVVMGRTVFASQSPYDTIQRFNRL